MSTALDQSLLEAALEGFESQLARINAQIAQVKSMMSGKKTAAAAAPPAAAATGATKGKRTRKSRVVSEEARQRMADAQKKRWAKIRAAKKG